MDESADEIDMSFDRLSLCEKISINFGSLEVGNFVDVTANSASGPVVTGFGSLRASHFASVVCDVDGCRIIAIDSCWLLRVADGAEALAFEYALLTVDVESAVFGFGCSCAYRWDATADWCDYAVDDEGCAFVCEVVYTTSN